MDYACTKIVESRQWYQTIDGNRVLCTHTEEYLPKEKDAK